MKRLQKIDVAVFNFFNKKIKSKLLDKVFPIVTHLGSALATVGFSFGVLLIKGDTLRNLGLLCLISLIISFFVIRHLKSHFGRIRPYKSLPGVNYLKNNLKDYSFPSGHTAAIAAVSFSILFYFPGLWYVAVLLIIAVGISRIYLGVHYPGDIIFGVIIGFLCTCIGKLIIHIK